MPLLITIAIPAFNRPALLLEGLRSIAQQTYADWEVVVIDDGSSPPIRAQDIRAVAGSRFKLIRNSSSKGVVAAKNAGIHHASGDVILHLDDDDLLAPDTLEKSSRALESHPELDGVYLNVEPFGRFEAGTRRNQERALEIVLREAMASEEEDLIFFNECLFGVLLKTVPMAFQRPVARKQTWITIGDTEESLYFGEPDWALRAALFCNFALLKSPLARWRVDGQNFASLPANRLKHSTNNIRIKQHIYDLTRSLPSEKRCLSRLAKQALGQAYFDQAYQLRECGMRTDASLALMKAATTSPSLNQAKLLLSLLLPRPSRNPAQ